MSEKTHRQTVAISCTICELSNQVQWLTQLNEITQTHPQGTTATKRLLTVRKRHMTGYLTRYVEWCYPMMSANNSWRLPSFTLNCRRVKVLPVAIIVIVVPKLIIIIVINGHNVKVYLLIEAGDNKESKERRIGWGGGECCKCRRRMSMEVMADSVNLKVWTTM